MKVADNKQFMQEWERLFGCLGQMLCAANVEMDGENVDEVALDLLGEADAVIERLHTMKELARATAVIVKSPGMFPGKKSVFKVGDKVWWMAKPCEVVKVCKENKEASACKAYVIRGSTGWTKKVLEDELVCFGNS